MPELGDIERKVINRLQHGLPLSRRPFAEVADELGIGEQQLIDTLQDLLERGLLSRFGPLYNAERMGGGLTLAAMSVPEADFDRVAAWLEARPEVAHNYARDHELNMWFVLATEAPEEIEDCIEAIEEGTGLPVYNFPKEREYFLDLRFEV
ncbi:Lrp/AsnC family transcriptional regulator [Thiohalobacter sp.]|uniref:Lrp/AsnC family transcriptional regulator n=1 Tax=Thiohalobacter sp. TaxID=2025948 RepID=UPI00260F68E3|nr:Lrp/AsnC family transcriptional regulator [Thiohalobacter sp.]